jgi:phosphoribosylcarboxyaminoimidazole (NCAIR) mutase
MLQNVPDSVVIAYVGMSNAAGPMLSANSMAPVITVPASLSNFHEDVWSSLRMPSNVPVSTVLNPANAFLAALRILAMRNPFFYALLAGELEKRVVNTVVI